MFQFSLWNFSTSLMFIFHAFFSADIKNRAFMGAVKKLCMMQNIALATIDQRVMCLLRFHIGTN